MENVKSFDKFINENTEVVNEAANYKQVEKIVVDAYEDLEQVINDSVLDSVFQKYPDAKVSDIKKALLLITAEVIDTWEQTAGD